MQKWLGLLLIALSGAWVAMGAPPGSPRTLSLDLGHGAHLDLVLIAPGSFMMGSDPNFSDGDETPAHRVTLTQPYYLGVCEVTQQQWTAVLGSNPSQFSGPLLPVDNVSWNDCQRFLAKASGATGRRLRLPTEAEWEYAARAGTTTRWFFGDKADALPEYAWCGDNAKGTTHAVATRRATPWGLYDVYGNVWEWCADWYGRHYSPDDAIGPVGPIAGDARVLRGGAWGDPADVVRSAYRNSMGPDAHNPGTGFRCAISAGAGSTSP